MKAVALLGLVLTVAACGSVNPTSNVSGVPGSPVLNPVVAERVLVPIAGVISSVKAESATPPASGLWTTVEVSFEIPCTHKLETSSVTYGRAADGKTQILASVFASTAKSQGQLVCQAFSTHTETVTLPGIATAADVSLVNLKAKAVDVAPRTIAIRAIPEMKVIAARPLCPIGTVCKIDGTVVTVEVLLNSCVNKIGPVAYYGVQDLTTESKSIKLAVNAIEFENELAPVVDCATTKKTTEISLPMLFADVTSIDLTVLK